MRATYGTIHRRPVHCESDTYHGIVMDMDRLFPPHLPAYKARESQKFQASYSRAIARTQDVRRADDERAAASFMLDTALRSVVQRATPDASGKRVGGPAHDRLIKGLATLAEMVRHRRSVWGQRWVQAARVAVRTKTNRHTLGHSPTRSRSYVVSAVHPGWDREAVVEAQARKALREHGTRSALCLVAEPRRILWTYDWYVRMLRSGAAGDLPRDRVLNVSVGYVERE